MSQNAGVASRVSPDNDINTAQALLHGSAKRLDSKTTPEAKKRSFIADPKWSSSWLPEGLAICTGSGLLIALAVTFSRFNGEQHPAWRYNINLNTVAALFSTIFRSMILVVIEEVVGQMKWVWFLKPRPAAHMKVFDQASRGPWGACRLMFSIPRQYLSVFAAILSLMSLAIGPFTQQAIRSVACRKPVSASKAGAIASIPVAHWLQDSTWQPIDDTMVDSATILSTMNAVVDPESLTNQLKYSCLTGNCTFPSYSTIGYCRKCFDNSDKINSTIPMPPPEYPTLSPPSKAFQLPNGLSILGFSQVSMNITLNPNNDPLDSENMSFIDWAIPNPTEYTANLIGRASHANITILSLTRSPCSKVSNGSSTTYVCPQDKKTPQGLPSTFAITASTCMVYSCLKSFTAAVENGSLTETELSSTPIYSPPDASDEDSMDKVVKIPCVINGRSFDATNISLALDAPNKTRTVQLNGKTVSVPEDCVYAASTAQAPAVYAMMEDLFTGSCSLATPGAWVGNTPPDISKYSAISRCYAGTGTSPPRSAWLEAMYNNGNITFDSVNDQMGAVATALTNRLRTLGTDWEGKKATASGAATEFDVCVQFDWFWLLFPTSVLLLSFMLLLLTAFQTVFATYRRYQPLWKTSILPILFYAPGSTLTDDIPLESSELDRLAEHTIVQFAAGEKGWSLQEQQTTDERGERI